ncbi:recombinase family protein [Anaeromicropila populeti]|uniref:Site-specific DNA recombinase n=1 Tax=Anaeromicropila populeti TaxID=37658 RepID=A0A1I6JNI1_9FIRM|nr:recombinase family protein [Anaeromicropila populeti]SFR80536.1 Site-specific DNA recombinase [Anaeromicropila populeti]
MRNKAGIYLRISKEERLAENQGENSLAHQRQYILDFIHRREEFIDWEIIEFADDGFSGTSFQRDSVQKMLQWAEKGILQCIIVKDISRFGRNYIETGTYLEVVFPQWNIRFIAINDFYDSFSVKGNIAGIDVSFRTIVYDLYSKDISQKVKAALEIRKKRGCFMGAAAPFGYLKSTQNKGRLEVDRKSAVVVKRIFQLRSEGLKLDEIASLLNQEGILPPSEYRKERLSQAGKDKKEGNNGKTIWSKSTISRILKNPVYIGTIVNGRQQAVQIGMKKKCNRKRSQWICVENCHDPIVSKKLFDFVQNILCK